MQIRKTEYYLLSVQSNAISIGLGDFPTVGVLPEIDVGGVSLLKHYDVSKFHAYKHIYIYIVQYSTRRHLPGARQYFTDGLTTFSNLTHEIRFIHFRRTEQNLYSHDYNMNNTRRCYVLPFESGTCIKTRCIVRSNISTNTNNNPCMQCPDIEDIRRPFLILIHRKNPYCF